ncbi:MAG TPA: tail protein X [Pyrinomonadaceae bacterium]|nr:tail protein X [Pyrinomonadaceae bacterium]
MTVEYETRAGDVVDEVAWRQYGGVDSTILRIVYEANPGLADRGLVLPAGVIIILPDIPQPSTDIKSVSLWD